MIRQAHQALGQVQDAGVLRRAWVDAKVEADELAVEFGEAVVSSDAVDSGLLEERKRD